MPGGRAGEQPGVAHVAGAVADERDGQAGELLLVLLDREQVGEQLAGVEVVGERVDDRDAGVLGHLLEVALRVGAPHDHRRLAAEHAGDVVHRLAHADAGEGAVDQHREAAELGDAGGERRLRAQRLLVEDHRDGARAGERLRVVRRVLELGREREDLRLLGRGQVVVGQEVPSCTAAPIASSRIARPGGEERVGVVLGEHERRREPDPPRGRVVDDEAGLQRGRRDVGRGVGGQVEPDEAARRRGPR